MLDQGTCMGSRVHESFGEYEWGKSDVKREQKWGLEEK